MATNPDTESAESVVLTDPIPVGTTYVAGSLQIDAANRTDVAGDDAGEVVGRNVTARLGTDSTSAAGGRLDEGASATVTFQVKVDESITESTVLDNTATVSYTRAAPRSPPRAIRCPARCTCHRR